jgi:hypothetical protein
VPKSSDGTAREKAMIQRFRKRQVVYSGHAREQMKRRRITEEDVESALGNADITHPGTDKKGRNLVKTGTAPDGRRLCVVVNKKRQHVVVSSYWR